jgi:hypothetical protein
VEGNSLKTYVDGKLINPCTDFPLGENELVFSTKHTLIVSYA